MTISPTIRMLTLDRVPQPCLKSAYSAAQFAASVQTASNCRLVMQAHPGLAPLGACVPHDNNCLVLLYSAQSTREEREQMRLLVLGCVALGQTTPDEIIIVDRADHTDGQSTATTI